jgi:hypothetical protein
LLPLGSQAQLRITEVESSENGGKKPDWWELTNLGNSPVDITGYRMDDDSASFALSVALSGVTSIDSGASVAFFEVAGTTPLTIQGFRDWWGLNSSVPVGTYSGSGVGLNNSGDAVNIYTSTGALVDGVILGTATKGVTFGWDPVTRALSGLSQLGVNGAFTAAQDGDIGSPGVVVAPEPSAWMILGLGLAGLFMRRRR